MVNCPVGKEASIFVSAIMIISRFYEEISLSASNLFPTESILRHPTITMPMFLNLNNFNEEFAFIVLSADVSGVDVSTPEISGP